MAQAPDRCGLKPMHPGELLREDVLPALKKAGTPATAFAERLGISRRTLYDILEGKGRITPTIAVKLGALLGNGAEIWGRLQLRYDLEMARAEIGEDLPAALEAPA